LIIIDKISLLVEASIRKRGVGGKNKIPQNIGSFMGSSWAKEESIGSGDPSQGFRPQGRKKLESQSFLREALFNISS